MAFTGQDFQFAFERRVDKSFNDYYDVQTSRDFYVRVLRLGLMEKYEALDKQRRYDELRGFITLDKTIPATSGRVMLNSIAVSSYTSGISTVLTTTYKHNASAGDTIFVKLEGDSSSFNGNVTVLSVPSDYEVEIQLIAIGNLLSGYITTPQTITDYLHLNSIKIKYLKKSPIQIDKFIVNPFSVAFTTKSYSKLRDYQHIKIDGVVGTANANGSFYIKQIADKKYQLFSDKDLTNPILGDNVYQSGGVLYVYGVTEPIFQTKPDQIQAFDKPTFEFPRWKISENSIVIEPSEYIEDITFNYLRIPPFTIDPENTSLDLLLFMPQELIEYFVDYAARLFDLETKDWQSISFDSSQVVTNK